jgi:hypothetical protein
MPNEAMRFAWSTVVDDRRHCLAVPCHQAWTTPLPAPVAVAMLRVTDLHDSIFRSEPFKIGQLHLFVAHVVYYPHCKHANPHPKP